MTRQKGVKSSKKENENEKQKVIDWRPIPTAAATYRSTIGNEAVNLLVYDSFRFQKVKTRPSIQRVFRQQRSFAQLHAT